ncbi:unnamed protein product [Thlaspi arvense]|uniref:Uncharacterized protein n=1 Tax=Thlaspi arvense TaxID=13288 RepID=A0AAU9RAU1_THLAR|nr:unnamed protein product [Thlaspi arvense]
MSNSVLQELLKISEEEFGLPREGPITLPFDSGFLEYLIKLIERRMDEDTEKALLMSISCATSYLHCSLKQQSSTTTQQFALFNNKNSRVVLLNNYLCIPTWSCLFSRCFDPQVDEQSRGLVTNFGTLYDQIQQRQKHVLCLV